MIPPATAGSVRRERMHRNQSMHVKRGLRFVEPTRCRPQEVGIMAASEPQVTSSQVAAAECPPCRMHGSQSA